MVERIIAHGLLTAALFSTQTCQTVYRGVADDVTQLFSENIKYAP